jgi:thioredoxin reductase (NADPH)
VSVSAARSSEYDVIVVGSGPAGISAGINIANRSRTVAVMGGQAPFGRMRQARSIPNYPGFTFTSGEDLAAAFLRHLEEFAVPLVREKVSKIMRSGDELIAFTEREAYRARAVVLATGVYLEAEIEGEEGLVGQGVSYCATCDGRLFVGRRAAVIGYAEPGEEEAAALAEDYGVDVTYVPQYQGEYRLPEGVRVLPDAAPARLARVAAGVQVTLPGEDLLVDAVFIYKNGVSPRALLEGVTSDGRHVTVNRQMETGVPGVFAAGDCTGEPYQIAKAVGEGQVAALYAVRFLRQRAQPAPRGATT